jgi:hypothetical protein
VFASICVPQSNDHEIKQLAHQVEDRAYRRVADQLAVLDALGRREQVDSRRMLAERRFELNRVELSRPFGERHDRAFGFQVQEYRQSPGLQVEIDNCNPLVERVAQCQCEVGRQARHAGAAYQAH